MAFDNNQLVGQGVASGAISPFLFVKQDATDDDISTAGANAVVLGVGPDFLVAAAEVSLYNFAGVTQLQLGGTVTAGDRLKSDAAGKGVVIATTGTTIQNVGGVARRSGVSGDVIPVQVYIDSVRPALV